jgi:hypothetical protein
MTQLNSKFMCLFCKKQIHYKQTLPFENNELKKLQRSPNSNNHRHVQACILFINVLHITSKHDKT